MFTCAMHTAYNFVRARLFWCRAGVAQLRLAWPRYCTCPSRHRSLEKHYLNLDVAWLKISLENVKGNIWLRKSSIRRLGFCGFVSIFCINSGRRNLGKYDLHCWKKHFADNIPFSLQEDQGEIKKKMAKIHKIQTKLEGTFWLQETCISFQ